MLSSLLGAFASKKAGGSAVKGAIAGKASTVVLRALGPVVGTAAVGYAAFRGWKSYKKNQDETGDAANSDEVVNKNNAAALGSAAISSTADNSNDKKAA